MIPLLKRWHNNRNEQHQQQAARKNKKSAGKAEKNRLDLRKQDEKAAWHFLFLLNDGKIFMTVVVTVLSIWTWSWTWILGTRFNWKLLAWPFIITLHVVLWLWHCVDWAKKGLRKKRGKKISRVSLSLRSSPIFNRESFTLNFSVHWLKTCVRVPTNNHWCLCYNLRCHGTCCARHHPWRQWSIHSTVDYQKWEIHTESTNTSNKQ